MEGTIFLRVLFWQWRIFDYDGRAILSKQVLRGTSSGTNEEIGRPDCAHFILVTTGGREFILLNEVRSKWRRVMDAGRGKRKAAISKGEPIETELCRAAAKGEVQRVMDMIAQGADVNTVGDQSIPIISEQTPLWAAVDGAGSLISKAYKEFWDSVSEVVPEFPRRDVTAKREAYTTIVRILLEAGADVSKTSHGSTPLRIAVHRQDSELVRLLLEYGADPNSECVSILSKLATKQGRKRIAGYYNAVLHEATEKGNREIVEILLAAGADCRRVDHEGKTALQIAEEKGFTAIAEVLRRALGEMP